VFKTGTPGTQKILLPTNIAETRTTIDDVVYALDLILYNVKAKQGDAKKVLLMQLVSVF